MSRRRYTGAGIYPRRLYTVPAYFRLLRHRADRSYKYSRRGSSSQGTVRKKKGERLKIHKSGTSFSLEMLILVRRSIESLGGSVIEVPLNFFADREFGYNEYLAIPQI